MSNAWNDIFQIINFHRTDDYNVKWIKSEKNNDYYINKVLYKSINRIL